MFQHLRTLVTTSEPPRVHDIYIRIILRFCWRSAVNFCINAKHYTSQCPYVWVWLLPLRSQFFLVNTLSARFLSTYYNMTPTLSLFDIEIDCHRYDYNGYCRTSRLAACPGSATAGTPQFDRRLYRRPVVQIGRGTNLTSACRWACLRFQPRGRRVSMDFSRRPVCGETVCWIKAALIKQGSAILQAPRCRGDLPPALSFTVHCFKTPTKALFAGSLTTTEGCTTG